MIEHKKELVGSTKNLVIGFDLEWTKNYKVKNGNKPFCFSFVFFEKLTRPTAIERDLEFGFYSCYCEESEDARLLVKKVDELLGKFLKLGIQITIVGHQLSSDIAVIINYTGEENAPNFVKLRELWRNRKIVMGKDQLVEVFDSRYDLTSLSQKSRRLVDVCDECGLVVDQPEIVSSMTKMQNDFYDGGDTKIMEMFSVLNIRHSLSAIILFLLSQRRSKLKKKMNVNKILFRNLEKYFAYVGTEAFKKLL